MNADDAIVSSPADRANSRNVVIAGFVGWTLDAFDFFVLTYVLSQVGAEFHRSVADMALTLTASLMMRPVGALLFGLLADRYGRRLPLILDVLFYSVVEVLSGLAPTYGTFFALRLLYGIGMGGEWGVGASLTMESVPMKWRGVLSGLLQEGYALGNLLAAVAYWTVFPHWGWRPLFFLGGLPALLTLFIRARVKESDAWKAQAHATRNWRDYFRAVASTWKRLLYLVVMMAILNVMSHGTQDLYPTFLQKQHQFSTRATAIVSVISMVGAIVGGILVGLLSDRWGRRRAMTAAALLALLLIPLWAFSSSVGLIATGAFLMQFMVQGAWGVVPVHLNELSPGAIRGFLPGFTYQIGVLLASGAPRFEAVMTRHYTYGQSMGLVAAVAFVAAAIVISAGPEAHRISFNSSEPSRE